MNILPPKDVEELIPITFDFTAVIPDNSTVTSPSITASVYSGNDSNPSAILYGAPQVTGGKVTQWITNGVAKTQYNLRCKITSSDGRVLVLATILPVMLF